MEVQKDLQRRWGPWGWGAQWPAIGSWQEPTERIIKAGPLKTAQEVAEEVSVDNSVVIRHLNQIGKVKKLDKWAPHELTSNQKNCHFEVPSSLIYTITTNEFSIVLWHMTKSGFYDNRQQPAQWLEEEAPEDFPKPNVPPTKVMVIVWWSAARPVQLSESRWTSEKYAQLTHEILHKLQRLQLALVTRKGPVLLHNNSRPHVAKSVLQKLNKLDYEVFPHLPYSPDLSPTHFFKHLDNFLKRKHLNNQQEAEKAFQELVEFQSMNFYAIGISKHFSLAKLCCL